MDELIRMYELTNEIQIDRIFNESENEYNEFMVSIEYNRLISESVEDMETVMEAKENSIVDRIITAISEIIDACIKFIMEVKDSIMGIFKDKENAKKLKTIRDNRDKIDPNKKVKINKHNDAAVLNEYVKELIVLERQLLLIKSSPEVKLPQTPISSKGSNRTIEAMEILNKLKSLDEKYDKKLIDDNSDIIEMASKDAIRFSEKQLENVELDFDAILNNSKKVLKEFKTDAKGCKEPVKLNILQRMIRSLATKIRKATLSTSRRHNKNFMAVLGLIGSSTLALGAKYVYDTNPKVHDKVQSMLDIEGRAEKKKAEAEARLAAAKAENERLMALKAKRDRERVID